MNRGDIPAGERGFPGAYHHHRPCRFRTLGEQPENQHGINDGVEVLHRSDYNYSEVADGIKDTVALFSTKTEAEIKEIRKRAGQVAEQALWKHFIQYYYEAYDIALRNAMKRQLK